MTSSNIARDRDSESDRGRFRRRKRGRGRNRDPTRRTLLVSLAAAAGLSTPRSEVGRTDATAGSVRRDSPAADATMHVRVYPGPVPLFARIRNGLSGVLSREFPVYRDATAAVEDALEQIAAYAAANSSLEDVETVVETAEPVRLSSESGSGPESGWGLGLGLGFGPFDRASSSQTSLLDRFRRTIRERELVTGSCCHLLLWWGPLNYDLGYGVARTPNKHVAALEDEGGQTIANVGATEVWDSRPVTRNIAIHETLHTFLSADTVRDVVGSQCDHHLGTAVKTDGRTMRVSPMATAYAGPDRIGGGTRFHGTGCYDHDAFYRHDGFEGVDRWEYTTDLSEATLEAVTLYLERYLS